MTTLAGNNSYTSGTTVTAGTLNFTGANTLGGATTVGNAAGTAVLAIGGNFTTNNIIAGSVANVAAAVYQSAGLVNLTGGTTTETDIGNNATASGYYRISGGTLSAGMFFVGNNGPAVMDITGGDVKPTVYFQIGRYGPGTPSTNTGNGVVNLSGGTLDGTALTGVAGNGLGVGAFAVSSQAPECSTSATAAC